MAGKYPRCADVVGTVYNGFKILDYKTENRRSFLKVECPHCKKIKWMRKDRVDIAKSCGCLFKETQFKPKNIAKKRFGRLVAIEPTEKRDKWNGSVIWKCQCDCGNIKEVSYADLIDESVSSCGCLAKETHSKNGKIMGQNIVDKYCIDGTNINNLTMKTPKNNTSGRKGVTWDKAKHKWVAQIMFKGKNYTLGKFENKDDAIQAREVAEKNMFGDFLEWYNESKKNSEKSCDNEE